MLDAKRMTRFRCFRNRLHLRIFSWQAAAFTLAVLVCCAPRISAQELEGVLNGSVTDPTGAVIPGATVKVVAEGGNAVPRTVRTNPSGNYTISGLAAGTYDLTVSAAGFKTFQAPNITLYVAQTRTVNAKLVPGAVTQTVTVQQTSVSLNTTTSELSGTISGKQVTQLQLNNRNFEQLVTLQPGVVSQLPDEVGFGLNNTSAVAVNGARDTANNWTVDGADINDSGSNSTLLNVPSVDAIQEFTMERSTYDAEYGRSGAGQILTSIRSGTDHFHGDAYEFGRNNIFNANNYFNKQTTPITPRTVERYNDYGFTLGGPIMIPKVYNPGTKKLFFFWSEEWRKVLAPETSSVYAATPDDLNGTFSGDLTTSAPAGCVTYNASTNMSTINPSCYSKNAKVYLTDLYDKFPANTSNGFYTFSYSQLENTREDLVRIDANLTDKLHFFAHAIQDETPENFPMGLFAGTNFPNVAGSAVNAPGENVVGNLTWTISPRMVNEAEFAYSQGTISSAFTPGSIATDPSIASQLTNNTEFPDPYGRIPGFYFKAAGSPEGFNYGSTPYFERNLDRTLFDNFSVTLGRHNFRVGATVSQMLKTENASSGEAVFEFNDFADFLLGDALQYTQASRDTIPDLHYFNFESYAQDDWRITKNVTLNLGMRWSYFPSPADVLDTLANFDPDYFNSANAPAIVPTGTNAGNFPAGTVIPANYANGLIYPAGKACSTAQSTALYATCSPWGAHVNPTPLNNWGPRFGFAYDVFGDGKTAVRGGYGVFYDRMLNGIWEQNAFQESPGLVEATVNNTQFDNPLAGTAGVSLGPNHIVATGTPGTPNMPNPSYQDFNLSVDQQITPAMLFGISYVGTLGRHLLGDRDLNQPTLAAREANPTAAVNAVVPYAGYSWFESRVPEYMSNFNSLQVTLNTREEHGLTAGIAYTWGHTLTNNWEDRDSETYDTYDPMMDYGNSLLNQPQTFVANFFYNLPFYKEQHGFAGHVLGGWEASGITTFESGTSITINQPFDNFDCQAPPAGSAAPCAAGTYPGGLDMDPGFIAPRPDRVSPVHMIKTQAQWFSSSSFADAVGHFGNSPDGVLLGPGLDLWDLSAIKNIAVGERGTFQFRGEFFNAFNHNSFVSDSLDTEVGDPSFGAALSSHDPREIQLGGKFIF